jgi:Ser/Thr protein kinase RdoA (MazF antagonist)
MPISRRVSREWIERDFGDELPLEFLELARKAAAALADCEPSDKVLLHGDVVPQNIIVSGGRVAFIDPIGFVGPAGWDVAQLAVAVPGRDRRASLADVVAGYSVTPPKLEPAFAYLAMVFYAKNREMERASPGTRAEFVSELGELAASLVRSQS